MRALWIVFAKEFIENLRDRRTLISALLFGPLFGPLLFGAMVTRMLNQNSFEADRALTLTISAGATMSIPSLANIWSRAATTSGSSFARSCGPCSRIVTRLPKRR